MIMAKSLKILLLTIFCLAFWQAGQLTKAAAEGVILVDAPCNFRYSVEQTNSGRAHYGGNAGKAADLMVNGYEAAYGTYQSCGSDTRVYAAISGTVVLNKDGEGAGPNCARVPALTIENKDLGIKVKYLHMDLNAANTVAPGQVARGVEIGTASDIGGCARGKHVHFEVYKWVDDKYVAQTYSQWQFVERTKIIPPAVPCKQPTESGPTVCPVYRFWSDRYQGHFYTIEQGERDEVIRNYPEYTWRYESAAYFAAKTPASGLSPMYRFWSDKLKAHFYTIEEGERDYVIANLSDTWKYERVAYYASKTQSAGTSPVYRFWSDKMQSHFYTSSYDEMNYLRQNSATVWKYEGVVFYAYK
jgi:hypothetical protein